MNQPEAPFDARGHAKSLLRMARTAALATIDRASGAPLTTLVSVASDYDGAPLLLLSALSAHTKNLAADPRASVLLTSPSGRGDPLNRPRLTVGGPIATRDGAAARARFIARNPKSKLYASFGDFSLFRIDIQAIHFNGGFGRAAPLGRSDILTDLAGAEGLLARERELLDEINARGAGVLARLAGAEGADRSPRWRAIGLDPEGLDLAAGARAARVSFAAPAPDARDWLAALDARLGGPSTRIPTG
ncbi:MAG: pyridoxamine 5'-phosphate oxidase family protein [Roseiarcus sp.]|jgi:putative heme iron utilization protein